MAYDTVLVGTDGSDSSFRAVERAAEVAAGAGATLVVVTAYYPLSDRERRGLSSQLGKDAYKVAGDNPARGILQQGSDRALAAGARVIETEAVEGDPVDVLVEIAQRRRADLVVIGNRGLSSFSGRLLGSVPQNVSHKATCDVLIVHTTS